jgi:hypothetical protein
MMQKDQAITEVGRLRNRHVAKLLDFLGETPPYLETAIKKSFSMFADDVVTNVVNSDNQGQSDDKRTNRI